MAQQMIQFTFSAFRISGKMSKPDVWFIWFGVSNHMETSSDNLISAQNYDGALQIQVKHYIADSYC